MPCKKKRYLSYKSAMAAAVKMQRAFRNVQTPYYCTKNECDSFHLTSKRAKVEEIRERVWFLYGERLKIKK